MTQTIVPHTETVRTHVAPGILGEPAEAAAAAVAGAAQYCADKMNRVGPRDALNRVSSDPVARGYFLYGLAKEVAAYLAGIDEEIRAVFLYDYDATPDDVIFGERQSMWPLRLVIRARRKTKALDGLTGALDHALAKHLEEEGVPAAVPILDIHFVDDADAQRGLGDGALLKSLHLPPLLVWER